MSVAFELGQMCKQAGIVSGLLSGAGRLASRAAAKVPEIASKVISRAPEYTGRIVGTAKGLAAAAPRFAWNSAKGFVTGVPRDVKDLVPKITDAQIANNPLTSGARQVLSAAPRVPAATTAQALGRFAAIPWHGFRQGIKPTGQSLTSASAVLGEKAGPFSNMAYRLSRAGGDYIQRNPMITTGIMHALAGSPFGENGAIAAMLAPSALTGQMRPRSAITNALMIKYLMPQLYRGSHAVGNVIGKGYNAITGQGTGGQAQTSSGGGVDVTGFMNAARKNPGAFKNWVMNNQAKAYALAKQYPSQALELQGLMA